MIETDAVLHKASRLQSVGTPFALATVVRCENSTSAKPGAKAIITANGDISGWIGGGCAQPAVIKTAKQALRDGQARLIRIRPAHDEPVPEGIIDFSMRCYSGGTLDIFIEPMLARPVLLIIGTTPVAQVLCALARRVGFAVTAAGRDLDETLFPDAERIVNRLDAIEIAPGVLTFVVVASQGKGDEEGLETALASGAEYISFVASATKAKKMKVYLRERGHETSRVETIIAPAGIEIGAVTPEEIALSVLAGVVQARRRGLGSVASVAHGDTQATDETATA